MAKKSRSTVKVFCIMMIGASVMAIVSGIYERNDSDRFLSICQETQAEVLRAIISRDPEDSSFSIVRYSVDGETYEERVDGVHKVGTKIVVLYDPNNPRDVRLPGESEMSALFALGFGGINLSFGW